MFNAYIERWIAHSLLFFFVFLGFFFFVNRILFGKLFFVFFICDIGNSRENPGYNFIFALLPEISISNVKLSSQRIRWFSIWLPSHYENRTSSTQTTYRYNHDWEYKLIEFGHRRNLCNGRTFPFFKCRYISTNEPQLGSLDVWHVQ